MWSILSEQVIKPVAAQVRDFQAIIGRETRRQCLDSFGGLPDILMACVGGGSNAIGERLCCLCLPCASTVLACSVAACSRQQESPGQCPH